MSAEDIVSTVRIGSLKQVLAGKKDKVETKTEQAPLPEDKTVSTEENMTYPDMVKAQDLLKLYAKRLIENKRRSLAAFFSDPVMNVQEGNIHFTVGSKTLATEIEEETRTLKDHFYSHKIHLENIEISVNAEKVKEYQLFSPKQQFDAMAKDYPVLKEFEQRFGLDFDI